MIATWMLVAIAAATLLAVAARALESALRTWRRPLRGVWVGALVASALTPVLGPTLASALRSTPAATVPNGTQRLGAFVVHASDAARARIGTLPSLEAPLRVLWLASSGVAFALIAFGAWRLARARRVWQPERVDGVPVLLADDVGPAVVGLANPAIVLPRWALGLEPPLRALILTHEAEHVRGHDPVLLTIGALAVVAMPWNPALWWQLKRLRAATELDCDARVLAAHHDRTRYGLLLLAVAQRRAMPHWRLGGAPALAESSSDLSRRIEAMRAPDPRHRVLASAASTLVAAAAIAIAIAACSARDVTDPAKQKRIAATNDVLKLPARTIAGDGNAAGPTRIDGPYFEFQVEQPVVQAPGSPGPRYPQALKAANVRGTVMAQFIVDTTGHAMPGSFKVLLSDHVLFTDAVRAALPSMRFLPARVGGRPVMQLVQQPFQFSLSR